MTVYSVTISPQYTAANPTAFTTQNITSADTISITVDTSTFATGGSWAVQSSTNCTISPTFGADGATTTLTPTAGATSYTVVFRTLNGDLAANVYAKLVGSVSAPATSTYSVANASTNEGASATVNVTTTNVANGTTLYWTVNATTADVSTTSGSFTISANAGSFTIPAIADSLTEGSEAYTISVRTGSTAGTVVATSTLTINDTSTTPATPTYSVANASTNEGASATVNVTTTNVANSTTLYWTVDATTADVSTTSGSFTISANAGSFTIPAIADSLTEGSEAYTISIRTGSTAGTVVATSTLTINDTSTTPAPTYSVSNASTNEGASATANVTTTNVANSTTLYWTVDATTADVSTTSGSFTISANAGSFTIPAIADSLTEGTETYTISVRTGSTAGTVVATSTLTINDTSTTPAPTYSVANASTNEGANATVNVTTTNVANGTTLYWTVGATSADVSPTSGSFTISANAGSFTIFAIADSTTEGSENYTISVKTGSTAGTIVAQSTLTINDTSTTPSPTFFIAPLATSVDEGGTVQWQIDTTNLPSGTLYWTNSGTTTAADFTANTNSGSITITDNSGTLNRTLSADSTTEGGETIIIQLRTGSTAGPIVAVSDTVTVNDTSLTPPTYSIAPGITSVNEGGSVTWTVTTTNFGTGTLYYTNSGTTVAGDFSDAVNSGSIAITNNSGTLTKTLNNDVTTEGSETIIMQLRTGSVAGTIVSTAATVTVNDTSLTPAYSVANASTNEGASATVNVTTANVANGTTLYWTVNATTADVSTTSGSFTISANAGSFTIPAIADSLTEGSEAYTISIRTGSTAGTVVATSTLTINDTSTTPPTYSIAPGVTTVNEGGSVTWTVTTTDFGSGILYYTNSGTTVAGDFSDAVNSGSITITNNSGTLTKTLNNDAATEGSETIIIQLRTGSTAGTIVSTSATVTVSDTSLTPTYSVGNTSTNEGSSATVNVTTANVANGTTLYWTVDATTADVSTTSGSFTISANAGSFTIPAIADSLTEGSEAYTISIRTGSTAGTVVATSTLTINDTSTTPPTYSIAPGVASINEGGSVTWTVTTTNFGSGTLYYTNSGTTVAGDFSDAVNSGSITITNNSGTLTKTLNNDVTTEGSETIIMQLRTGSTAGTIVATATTVTVNDTSTTPPTYSISPGVTSVNEGGSVTWTITTTDFGSGTLYYTNSGTTVAGDFSDAVNSGSITITNNSGSLSKTLNNDITTEGSETIIMQLRTGSTAGTIVATATTVTVNDTSTTPITYAISPGVTSVNEGGSVTWTITTANFGTGTLYYTNSGTTVAGDFSDAVNSGSIAITNNSGTLSKTLLSDITTEGSETIIMQLRTGSTAGTVVATATSVTVNDISTAPDAFTFTDVTGATTSTVYTSTTETITGLQPNYSLTITASGGTVDAGTSALSGTFAASKTVTTSATGTLVVAARATSSASAGTQVNCIVTIGSVSDTFSITTFASGTQVAPFTFTDVNNAAFNTVYTSNTITVSGLNAGLTTSVTVAGGTYSKNGGTYTFVQGSVVNGDTLNVRVTSSSNYSTSVSSTLSIFASNGSTIYASVSDTFTVTTPKFTYSLTPNFISINEGNKISLTLETTGVADGTVLYWTLDGATTADFLAVSGSFTVNSNIGTFNITALSDVLTEGTETYTLSVRSGSTAGTVLTTSTVLLTDPPTNAYGMQIMDLDGNIVMDTNTYTVKDAKYAVSVTAPTSISVPSITADTIAQVVDLSTGVDPTIPSNITIDYVNKLLIVSGTSGFLTTISLLDYR